MLFFVGNAWSDIEPLAHPLLENIPLNKEVWSPDTKKGDVFEAHSASDVVIALHTLFPTEQGAARVDQEEKLEEVRQKAEVLSRFLILLKEAPLHLVTSHQKKGNQGGSPWPYAMAMALGHGQRVLITVPNTAAMKVLSWLFTGDIEAQSLPSFVKKRTISSHSVQKKGNDFDEVKMSDVSGTVINFIKGACGQHLYINMPWGGLGQVGPDGLLNDASGKRYDFYTKKRDDKIKLGHFYVYWDEIDGTAVLLIGIETCSPGSQNPFGVAHSITSGMKDLSKNRAVNGGNKWSVLLDEEYRPAPYGGMRVYLNDNIFKKIEKKWIKYVLKSDVDKVKYMRDVLENNAIGECAFNSISRQSSVSLF